MKDIHDCAKRLEAARRRLSRLRHGELLLAFLDHLETLGLSQSRVLKYANSLCTVFRYVPFNPAEVTRRDVEKVIAWINRQPYRDWTKHDLKMAVRKVVQYAKCGSCDRMTCMPAEVSWIPMKVDERDSRVTPEKLLSANDVKAMIVAAENERDKALISVLFEAALRPSELLTMTVGSVEFKREYCLITVKGKTGIKRIPLVASHALLLNWLQKHPRNNDVNAPLWINLSNNGKGGRMSYSYFRKMLKRVAKKAGLHGDIWPYLFRHSTLTAMAKVLTEAKLEQFAGWTIGSKMAKRYVHFSAKDLEEAVLEIHGLKQTYEKDNFLKVIECPRCGNKNPPSNVRCSFCGYILNRELAIKMEGKNAKEKRQSSRGLRGLNGPLRLC